MTAQPSKIVEVMVKTISALASRFKNAEAEVHNGTFKFEGTKPLYEDSLGARVSFTLAYDHTEWKLVNLVIKLDGLSR